MPNEHRKERKKKNILIDEVIFLVSITYLLLKEISAGEAVLRSSRQYVLQSHSVTQSPYRLNIEL